MPCTCGESLIHIHTHLLLCPLTCMERRRLHAHACSDTFTELNKHIRGTQEVTQRRVLTLTTHKHTHTHTTCGTIAVLNYGLNPAASVNEFSLHMHPKSKRRSASRERCNSSQPQHSSACEIMGYFHKISFRNH